MAENCHKGKSRIPIFMRIEEMNYQLSLALPRYLIEYKIKASIFSRLTKVKTIKLNIYFNSMYLTIINKINIEDIIWWKQKLSWQYEISLYSILLNNSIGIRDSLSAYKIERNHSDNQSFRIDNELDWLKILLSKKIEEIKEKSMKIRKDMKMIYKYIELF